MERWCIALSGRCKLTALLLTLALLLCGVTFPAAAQETPAIPEGYEKMAESSRFNLYLHADTLAIILESRASGKLLYSTAQNTAELKDNAAWKGFYSSGVVMEYIEDVKSTTTQADFLNNAHEVEIAPEEGGFTAAVRFPDIGISWKLTVTLDEWGLNLTLPQSSVVEENEKYTLAGFYLYPFLGSSYLGQDKGYMIIPDGQGALVNLENNEGRFTSPFDRPVYGTNIGVEDTVNSRWMVGTEPIIIPVFGMVHTEDQLGFLGVIESGDCAARICCYPNGVRTGFDWVAAHYLYRRVYQQPTGPSSGTISMRTEHARSFDIRQHFLLADGADATYAGLAVAWRDYMDRMNFFANADSGRAFDLELDLVGLERENFVLGKTDVVMTSIRQAEEMLGSLHEGGLERASVVWRGWQEGGLTGGLPTDGYNPAGGIGGVSGMDSMIRKAGELGYDLALEADFLSMNPETHPALTYSAFKKITSETWSRGTFGSVYSTMQYLTPERSLEIARNTLPAMAKAGAGVSLKGITSLMSDYYYKSRYKDSSVLMGIYRELVQTAASQVRTTLQAPNAYLWPEAHAISDVPVAGSSYTYTDREVPLLAIALSGRMPAYAEYVNFQANTRHFFLQLVEQGTRPCFLLTMEDPIKLQNTNSSDIYSSSFELYRDTILTWYRDLAEVHRLTDGQSIVNHQMSGDVTKVTWSGGTVVYVNFGETAAEMDGVALDALSYKVVE